MPIVLFRVDERLIHGQVVVGWGAQLHPERIVVVDDELADSKWEQELYTLGLPSDLEAEFEPVSRARDLIDEWRRSPRRTLILTRDISTMRRLGEGGLLREEEVNIGGIHFAPGRDAVLPYVFLSSEERAELRKLAADGAVIQARDLPGSRRVELADLLDEGGASG